MNAAEQKLFDYLCGSCGVGYLNQDLKQLIHSVYQSGMRDAAEIVQSRNTALVVEKTRHLIANTILTAANKP